MPQTPSRTPAQFSLFQAKELVTTPEHAQVPGGLPLWLGGFVREAVQETETLRHNGAEQATAARTALLTKLVAAARAWLDAALETGPAAKGLGGADETMHGAERAIGLVDRLACPKGRHPVTRRDPHT